jgi:hypothetical protein
MIHAVLTTVVVVVAVMVSLTLMMGGRIVGSMRCDRRPGAPQRDGERCRECRGDACNALHIASLLLTNNQGRTRLRPQSPRDEEVRTAEPPGSTPPGLLDLVDFVDFECHRFVVAPPADHDHDRVASVLAGAGHLGGRP